MTGRRRRSAACATGVAVAIGAASVAFGAASTDDPPATATATAVRLDPPLRSFTVLFAGDVLTEDRVMRLGAEAAAPGGDYDFGPMFEPVRAMVRSADLAVCHMEVPIAWPGQRPGYWGTSPFGGNLLLSPYEMADSLRRTGFDRCSTASNHSNDLGIGGIESTLAALDAAGISHAGTGREPAEATPSLLVVNGVRVAHLAYTRYSNTVPQPDAWRVAFAATPQQVANDVAAARAAGAEVVIVSLHLSKEMQTGPTPDDRAFATQLVQIADVDMVVHHGPHVVQPMEIVDGTPVWWSIGNFVSAMGTAGRGRYSDPRSLDGLFATARFTERADGRFDVRPSSVAICDEASSRTVRAPSDAVADPATAEWLRAEMQACLDRTRRIVPDAR